MAYGPTGLPLIVEDDPNGFTYWRPVQVYCADIGDTHPTIHCDSEEDAVTQATLLKMQGHKNITIARWTRFKGWERERFSGEI